MKLDRVTAELRPRETWEASDFGARLVRRDGAQIYAIWFAITLPLIGLSLAAIWFTPYSGLVLFVYWWLEPLADGPILHFIARRLFGEDPGWKGALRLTPRLAWQNRLFLLTPYRFHFARSVAMPVTQLEGLKGQARRQRSAVINNYAYRHGTGLTIVYQHVAAAIYIGIFLLGFVFIPAEFEDTLGGAWLNLYDPESGPVSASLNLLCVYIAQSILQPWFVGAGFGLYINCRTRLEAWDLEVAFRRMVERRAARAGRTGPIAAALLIAAILFTASAGGPAHAQDSSAQVPNTVGEALEQINDADAVIVVDPGFDGFWTAEELDPALEAVMADARLHPYQEAERWVRISDGDEAEEQPVNEDPSPIWGWFESLGKLIATLIEFGLWITIGAVLIFLFAIRDRWLPYLQAGPGRRRRRQRVLLAGGEVTEESLPEDIPAEVMRLWSEGRRREAMSLLYRGSVFTAVCEHGVRLPGSATEGDCLKAVAGQSNDEQTEFFRRMVSAWLWCAYGSRDPDGSLVRGLCDDWPSVYGAEA